MEPRFSNVILPRDDFYHSDAAIRPHDIGNAISEKIFSSNTIIEALKDGMLGYTSFYILTSINPVIGFVYGATHTVIKRLVSPIFEGKNSTTSSHVLSVVIRCLVSASITLGVMGMTINLASIAAVSIISMSCSTLLVLAVKVASLIIVFSFNKLGLMSDNSMNEVRSLFQ